jgi:hypothetical protein
METTLSIDSALLKEARRFAGDSEKTVLVRMSLGSADRKRECETIG